ncbi:MAG: HAMP domain-containing sensor histidine kinase, partial [Candidatus Roizmanbacteria bacterium]|nr:HAMP domain-containing sensor histidine kinase [Candidatus Roizmanbacteria bacterium]
ARLKLTAWYLLIIMFISIAFSLVIYRGSMSEVHRFSRMQRLRIERLLPPNPTRPFIVDEDLITEIQQRIVFGLGIINVIIFIISGALGYFLAGKTLRPIQEMVEEQNRFISDASHELRTPLTALKSSLEVNLRDKNLSIENAKKTMSESIEDVNDLQRLSDSLLDLSQYQKPFSVSNFKNISLNTCINEAVKKVTPLAKQKQITFKKNVEEINIKGIKDDLINLFVIILDNAIKYSTKKTSIRIYAKKTNNQIIIEIRDQGIGIEKKDLSFIFDRFFRADQSRSKEKVIGYGLGLSIAKKIVLNHHGKISATSQVDKGSVFTINFPNTA